ncbi:hypothetical protein P7C73_g5565, partial [Tremellales sp. Uapishka_1]
MEKLAKLEKEVQGRKAACQTKRGDRSEVLRLEEKLRNLDDRNAELEADVGQLQEKARVTEAQLAEAKSSLRFAEQLLKVVRRSKDEEHTSESKDTSPGRELEEAPMDEMGVTMTGLQDDLARSRSGLDVATSKIGELEKEVGRLEEGAEGLKTVLEKKEAALLGQLEELESEVRRLRGSHVKEAVEVPDRKVERDELEDESEELDTPDAEKEEAKSRLAASMELVDELEDKLEEKGDKWLTEKRQLEDEIRGLEKELRHVKRRRLE